LTGERQGLVCALRLGHAEDLMIACIVNLNVPTVIDCEASGKHGIPKVISGADCTWRPEIGRPPIRTLLRSAIANLITASATSFLRGRFSNVGGQLTAYRIKLGFQLVIEHIANHGHTGRPLRHSADSAWLNWAIVPPPERSARSIVRTASGETECLSDTREIKLSSFSGIESSSSGTHSYRRTRFPSISTTISHTFPFEGLFVAKTMSLFSHRNTKRFAEYGTNIA
jgi:hypothetical protein